MPEAVCADSEEAARQKKKRGEELTEDEHQLLDEDAVDPCPTPLGMRAVGPLQSGCDVEYCEKCHRLGHLGGIFLLVALFLVLFVHTGLAIEEILAAVAAVGVIQHLATAYLGYYPILGPVLGVALKPALPPVLQRDVRLSDYLPGMAANDRESPGDERIEPEDDAGLRDRLSIFSKPESEPVDDRDPEEIHAEDENESERVRKLRELYQQEKRERKEAEQEARQLKNKKKETESRVNEKEQEKSRIQSRVQEIRQEKEELEDQMEFFSHYRRNPEHANATPADVKTENGVKKQGYWVLDWFKMDLRRDHCRGRFWFAIVLTEEELRRGDYNEAPDLMDEDEARQRYGDKVWPPLPDSDADEDTWAAFNPPKFLDADRNHIPEKTREVVDEDGNTKQTHTVKEFDEAEPQLFEERMDDVREAIADGQLAKLTLLYDESGTYRGPDYDASSFKTRSEWREKARGWKKRTNELQSQVAMMQDDIEDMRHSMSIKEQELDEKERRLERLRDQVQQVSRQNRAQELTNQQLEQRYDRLSAEATELETQLEAADQQRQQERRARLSDSNQADMDEVSATRDADVQEAQDAALAMMQMFGYQGNGREMNIQAIRRGTGDLSRGEAIHHFMNDDAVDREEQDKIREVMDVSMDRLMEGAV